MKVDLLSLASGAVITGLGAVVLIDSSDALDFAPGWVAVAVTVAVGVIVLFSGLADRGPDSHD